MNILFDLRWMVVGKAGGMEQMAFELLSSLLATDLKDRFWVYCPDATFKEWGYLDDDRFALIDSDRFSLVPERALYELGEYGERSTRFGVAPKSELESSPAWIGEVDLIHSIGGYIAEELRNYPSVLTLHDLQHVNDPENFDRAEVGARIANYSASFESASAVICVSESVKTDLLENFDIDPEKTVSIWNIPSGSSLDELDASITKKVSRKLLGDTDFIFYPSHAWPHKNHERLLEAFARVSKDFPDLKLVLTGGQFDQSHPGNTRIRELGLESKVAHLGYRTPFEIRCLYREAKALVYPSMFEGFGMPITEANLAGTPVACSDIPPLREVGGNAIVTFDPENAQSIADALIRALSDTELRETLVANGRSRRYLFDAGRIAKETNELYRSVVGLEPIEIEVKSSVRGFRWERIQHWRRVFLESVTVRNWVSIFHAWLAMLWISPRHAVELAKNCCSEKAPIDGSAYRRHGDGWIGPRFEDWLMVPEGVRSLELSFEGPPSAFREGSILRVKLDDDPVFEDAFDEEETLCPSFDLAVGHPKIVKIEVACDRYFVPKEQGLNEDQRHLSAKLIGIRWIR